MLSSRPHHVIVLGLLTVLLAAGCGEDNAGTPGDDGTPTDVSDSTQTDSTTGTGTGPDPTQTDSTTGTGTGPDPTQTDSAQTDSTTGTGTGPDPTQTDSATGTQDTDSATAFDPLNPLYFAITVHVEAWQAEDTNSDMFDIHAGAIRQAASDFSDGGGLLTIEASKKFIDGCVAWDDNVLAELNDLGHHVGQHADVGGNGPIAQNVFNTEVRNYKDDITALQPVRHVSGVCSGADWVHGSYLAGYELIAGAVAFCLKAYPVESLPVGWENVATCENAGQCHGAPTDDWDLKLHPYRVSQASAFLTPDPDGDIVLSLGEGSLNLSCVAEGETQPQCDQTAEDGDAVAAKIEEALAHYDPSRINVLYFAWSIGALPDDGFAGYITDAVKPFVEAGQVQWATMPEILDSYLDWEQTQH